MKSVWGNLPSSFFFPDSSVGKESAHNAEEPGSIPESGRSAGEGIGYLLQYSWTSLVAQLVKNLPALWETWVWSLGWEDPLEKGSVPGLGRSSGEGKGYPLQYSWASLVAQLVKNLPALWETWVWSLGWEDLLEKEMATHSSTVAWRIPRTEKPGRLQSMESQKSQTRLSNFTFTFTLLTIKSFDCVDQTNCGKFFKKWEYQTITYLLRNLYASQEATVRTGYGTMDWF